MYIVVRFNNIFYGSYEFYRTIQVAGCFKSTGNREGIGKKTAAPGAGKTTLVPPALLCAPFTAGKRIDLLEPRRVAARAAAQRIAALLGEKCGESCGYIVRGESCISARTRLFVVTEGVMLRKIQEDPLLEEASTIIFDEFHDRAENTPQGSITLLSHRKSRLLR